MSLMSSEAPGDPILGQRGYQLTPLIMATAGPYLVLFGQYSPIFPYFMSKNSFGKPQTAHEDWIHVELTLSNKIQ